MRDLAVLKTAVDPNTPMPEAFAVLTRAAAIANTPVPTVPTTRTTARQARKFRRAISYASNLRETGNTAGRGATRFVRARTGAMATFAAKSRIPDMRRRRMASSMLMAGSSVSRKQPNATVVQMLDVMRARSAALSLVGTLRQRFALNVFDMRDGKPDLYQRLMLARGRGRNFDQLIYA